MDEHFRSTKLGNNIPILMALIGFFNINIRKCNTHAIVPYSNKLGNLISYLQQLEMESNGKTINSLIKETNHKTSPVMWGGTGSNVQHSFMQSLHQGNTVVPIDFIVPLKNDKNISYLDKINIFNCIGQSSSLLYGNGRKGTKFYCPCNKPSTTILLNEVDPVTIGSLISAYEHKVYIQSILWDINAFDQYGVELGKTICNNTEKFFKKGKLDGNKFNTEVLEYLNKYY